MKNFLTLTLIAYGTPMLLMGDEVRRTQGGNNNAYCHNNEISWFDWTLLDKHPDIHRFAQHFIRLRLTSERAVEDVRLTLNELLQQAQIDWHGALEPAGLE
jgi:glycogen operon protein